MNRIVSRRKIFRILSVFLLLGVLMLSFLPPDLLALTRWEFGHPVAYALLVIATLLSLPRRRQTLWAALGVIISISLLGIVIELLQPLTGRTTSPLDLAGNEIGIAAGLTILCGYLYYRKSQNKRKQHVPRGG